MQLNYNNIRNDLATLSRYVCGIAGWLLFVIWPFVLTIILLPSNPPATYQPGLFVIVLFFVTLIWTIFAILMTIIGVVIQTHPIIVAVDLFNELLNDIKKRYVV